MSARYEWAEAIKRDRMSQDAFSEKAFFKREEELNEKVGR
jgi:hypothetical protein